MITGLCSTATDSSRYLVWSTFSLVFSNFLLNFICEFLIEKVAYLLSAYKKIAVMA